MGESTIESTTEHSKESAGALEDEPERIPGVDISDLDPSSPVWPDGVFPKVVEDREACARIGNFACRILGYSQADRPDGQFADRWVLDHLPESTLLELIQRCKAGTLQKRHVAMTVAALNIPHAVQQAAE